MEERITYLFRKFQEGNCSRTEFDELFQYITLAEEDSAVKEVFESVFDNHLDVASALHEMPPVDIKTVRKTWRQPLLVAAGIVVLLVAGFWMYHLNSAEKYGNNVLTAATDTKEESSETRLLVLPDSTKVWMNVGSTLEYPESFAGAGKREVILKGEAFFDVRHADKIPFVIRSGDVTTEVLGTAFNIKAYPDMKKVTVSVQRGKVKVHYAKKTVAVLQQGQEVSIVPQSRMVKEKRIDVSETAGWQQGKLVYDDYAVEDIVKDMERVFGAKIVVESPELKKLHVTTSFLREHGIDKALEILCVLTDKKLEKKNDTYFIN